MQFRKDINGLRAIAVIAVVIFHFNMSWMPGGFAGVDVFFVISGFLMTGIIFKGIEQDNFSIMKFYVARANRIIPALALLCLVLLVFGWFYLIPSDFRSLGMNTASSVGFISNIIYWYNSGGYFAASSHENWLLHTWSLSAEWQFYIIYPVVLVIMRKIMSVNAMKATIVLGTLVGFIYCIITSYNNPNFSYYLLPTRAWEMMIGGVAYLYPFMIKDQRKKLVERLGLSLIIGSYFLISKDNPWPGYLAIFPVLGSLLIIQAQRNDSFITSNIVMQKLGAWSYSIYLWHWPLVVAIYYFSLNEVFIYLGLALSVLLGFLSNRYIENIKFKNDFNSLFSYFHCKPLYMVVVASIFGCLIYIKNGNFNQFPKEIMDIIYLDMKKEQSFTWRRHNSLNEKSGFISDSSKVLVIGDSQSADLINIFKVNYSSDEIEIVSRVISHDCGMFYIPPEKIEQALSENVNTNYRFGPDGTVKCQSKMTRAMNPSLLNQADVIFIAMGWRFEFLPHMKRAIYELNEHTTAKVVIVGSKRVFIKTPKVVYFKEFIFGNVNDIEYRGAHYLNTNTRIINDSIDNIVKNSDSYFLDIGKAVCNVERCNILANGKPVFYDKNHFTKSSLNHIAKVIEPEMNKLLGIRLLE